MELRIPLSTDAPLKSCVDDREKEVVRKIPGYGDSDYRISGNQMGTPMLCSSRDGRSARGHAAAKCALGHFVDGVRIQLAHDAAVVDFDRRGRNV
jgi:hypothetical protein